MSAIVERSAAYERTYVATVAAMPELYDRHRVAPEDLWHKPYRDLLESVLALHLAGVRVTPTAIRAELDRRNLRHLASGDLLDTLGEIDPDLEPIAKRITELAVTRRMRDEARALTAALARDDLRGARDVIANLSLAHDPSTERDPVMSFGELLEKSVLAIRDEGASVSRLIRIGSPTIDRFYRLSPGSLMTIGGGTNVGKSTIVITWALMLARAGVPVGIVSVEDPPEDWGAKAMGEIAGINPSVMWRGELSREHWATLLAKIPESRDLPVSFSFVSDRSVDGVLARMEYMRRVRGCRVIAVDYLQAINHRAGPPLRERIDATLEELIAMAGRLDVALVLTSQLSRFEKGNPFREPQLSDLKECVTGDQLVMDARTGMLRTVRDVAASGGLTAYALDNDWKARPADVERAWSTGTKPVFKVRTKSGRTLRATGNHPLRVLAGWRPLSELRVGDRIAVPRWLPEPIEARDTLSDEQLRMLGYLISDGHYGKHHSISFVSADPVLQDDICRIAPKFGVEARETSCRGIARQFYLSNGGARNPLAKWLRELGIYGDIGASKKAPAVLFAQTNRSIGVFLGALWAGDGSVIPRKSGAGWSLKFTNTSGVLLDQVQWMLTRLGVVSVREPASLSTRVATLGDRKIVPRSAIASVMVSDAAAIRRFAEAVPIPGRKGELLRRAAAETRQRRNSHVDRLPIEVTERVTALCVASGTHYRDMRQRLGYKPQGKSMGREDLARFAATVGSADFAALADSDVLWDKIVSIEPDGEDEVFDLSVPGPNNFVVSNIFAHNSGSIENRSQCVVLLWRENDQGGAPVKAKIAKAKRQPAGERFTLVRDPRTSLLVEHAEEGARWPGDDDAPAEVYQ